MPSNADQIITRRTTALLILIGGATFCAFLALTVLIDPADRVVTGPSSYSRSAVGHAALAKVLEQQGYSVEVNRSRNGRGIGTDEVLLILEPDLRLNSVADLRRLIDGKGRVLIALPKWRPRAMANRRGWIEGASLVSTNTVEKVARAVIVFADVERPEQAQPWTDRFGLGTPTIDSPQLLSDTELDPLIVHGNDILAGESTFGDSTRVLLVSDPDIFANHGLHRDDNARLALGLIQRLLPSAHATIHFDESLHGFAIVPSLPRLLFTPPFLAASLLALGAVAIVVWRASARFGAPATANDAGSVFGSGHETLLHNAGRLLAGGNHGSHIAERYGRASLEEAAGRLHLSGHRRQAPNEPDLRSILHGIAARRGVRTRLPGNGIQRPLARARRYYDWMEEMFGGPGSNLDAR